MKAEIGMISLLDEDWARWSGMVRSLRMNKEQNLLPAAERNKPVASWSAP